MAHVGPGTLVDLGWPLVRPYPDNDGIWAQAKHLVHRRCPARLCAPPLEDDNGGARLFQLALGFRKLGVVALETQSRPLKRGFQDGSE